MPQVTEKEKQAGKDGKEAFLKRCFHATKQEGKPEQQRIAQCLNMWKEANRKKKTKGSNESPSWDEYEIEDGFIKI